MSIKNLLSGVNLDESSENIVNKIRKNNQCTEDTSFIFEDIDVIDEYNYTVLPEDYIFKVNPQDKICTNNPNNTSCEKLITKVYFAKIIKIRVPTDEVGTFILEDSYHGLEKNTKERKKLIKKIVSNIEVPSDGNKYITTKEYVSDALFKKNYTENEVIKDIKLEKIIDSYKKIDETMLGSKVYLVAETKNFKKGTSVKFQIFKNGELLKDFVNKKGELPFLLETNEKTEVMGQVITEDIDDPLTGNVLEGKVAIEIALRPKKSKPDLVINNSGNLEDWKNKFKKDQGENGKELSEKPTTNKEAKFYLKASTISYVGVPEVYSNEEENKELLVKALLLNSYHIIYYYTHYHDGDNSKAFYYAAQTRGRELGGGDDILYIPYESVDDFTTPWEHLASSETLIDSISIFGHGGKSKLYMHGESLSSDEILKLQKLSYTPNGKIDIRSCRSALSEDGKLSVAEAFYKSQHIDTEGLQNYGTFSTGPTEKIGLGSHDKEASGRVYLDSYNYNQGGLRKGYSEFPFLSGMTEHKIFTVEDEFITPKYPDIPGTAELKQ